MGCRTRISQDPVFLGPPVSLGGNYPCELKGWAWRSETLGAKNGAAVTELSTGAGGVIFFKDTWKSLEGSRHHCQESRRASSDIPGGPVLIRDKYKQGPVETAVVFPCKYGSSTGHLLFFGLPIYTQKSWAVWIWVGLRQSEAWEGGHLLQRGDTHTEGKIGVSQEVNEWGRF